MMSEVAYIALMTAVSTSISTLTTAVGTLGVSHLFTPGAKVSAQVGGSFVKVAKQAFRPSALVTGMLKGASDEVFEELLVDSIMEAGTAYFLRGAPEATVSFYSTVVTSIREAMSGNAMLVTKQGRSNLNYAHETNQQYKNLKAAYGSSMSRSQFNEFAAQEIGTMLSELSYIEGLEAQVGIEKKTSLAGKMFNALKMVQPIIFAGLGGIRGIALYGLMSKVDGIEFTQKSATDRVRQRLQVDQPGFSNPRIQSAITQINPSLDAAQVQSITNKFDIITSASQMVRLTKDTSSVIDNAKFEDIQNVLDLVDKKIEAQEYGPAEAHPSLEQVARIAKFSTTQANARSLDLLKQSSLVGSYVYGEGGAVRIYTVSRDKATLNQIFEDAELDISKFEIKIGDSIVNNYDNELDIGTEFTVFNRFSYDWDVSGPGATQTGSDLSTERYSFPIDLKGLTFTDEEKKSAGVKDWSADHSLLSVPVNPDDTIGKVLGRLDEARRNLGLKNEKFERFLLTLDGEVLIDGSTITLPDGSQEKIIFHETEFSKIQNLELGATLTSPIVKELFKQYPGYKSFYDELGPLLGTGMLEATFTTPELAQAAANFYENMFKPIKDSFSKEMYSDLGTEGAMLKALKSTFELGWIKNMESRFPNTQDFDEWKKLAEQVYNLKVKHIVSNTFDYREDWQIQKLIEAMSGAFVFDQLMRDVFELEEGKSFSPAEFSDKILAFDQFIQAEKYAGSFSLTMSANHKTIFKSKLFDTLNPTGDTMSSPLGETTHYGWSFETSFFLGDYITDLADIFIALDCDISKINNVFQFIETNPAYFNRRQNSAYDQGTLKGKALEVAKMINNGIDLTKYNVFPKSGREFDIMVVETVDTFYFSHCKNFKESIGFEAKYGERIKSITNDNFETIDVCARAHFTSKQYQEGQIQGKKQETTFLSPLYLDRGDGSDLSNARDSIKTLLQVKGSREAVQRKLESANTNTKKGRPDKTAYYSITALLNEEIAKGIYGSLNSNDQFNNEFTIRKIFESSQFKQDARKAVHDAYAGKRAKQLEIDEDWDSKYKALEELFVSEAPQLLALGEDGSYSLAWDDAFGHGFLQFNEQGEKIKIDINMFSGSGGRAIEIVSSKYSFRAVKPSDLKVPLIAIHKGSDVACIRSDQLELLPEGYQLGVKDSQGEVHMVIVNDNDGNLIGGRFKLLEGVLVDQGEEWFNTYLDSARYFSKVDGQLALKNYYRSIFYLTGSSLNSFLQETNLNFKGDAGYCPYVNSIVARTKGVFSKERRFEFKLDRSEAKRETELISSLFLQFEQGFSRNLKSDEGLKRMWLAPGFYSIHSYDGSKEKFIEFLNDVQLENNDPIFQPSSVIYSDGVKVFDSSDPSLWTRAASVLRIKQVQNEEGEKIDTLKFNYLLSDSAKKFSNAWLLLLQNNILKHTSESKFWSYRTLLFSSGSLDSPKRFSEFSVPTKDLRSGLDDFDLMYVVEGILFKELGFDAYFGLKWGILSINEQSNREILVTPVALQNKQFSKVFNKIFKLKSFKGDPSIPITGNRMAMNQFRTAFLTGFTQYLAGNLIDRNGKKTFFDQTMDFIPSSCEGFIDKYFNVYNPSSLSIYDFNKILRFFEKNEYNGFKSVDSLSKMTTQGREQIRKFLISEINDYLDRYFNKLSKDDPLFIELGLSEESKFEFWKQLTKLNYEGYINKYIDSPTVFNDLIVSLRNVFENGLDFELLLEKGEGMPQNLESNPFISRGIKITLDKSLCLEFLEGNIEASFSLIFDSRSIARRDLQYKLSFEKYLTEEKKEKIGKMLSTLLESFNRLLYISPEGEKTWITHAKGKKLANYRKYCNSETFNIKFTKIQGGGIGQQAFSHAYGPYGFKRNSIAFEPSLNGWSGIKGERMMVAIAAIVFYTFILPDSVAKIDVGGKGSTKNFLTLNPRKVFTVDEVLGSKLTENLKFNKLSSIWDNDYYYQFKDLLTSEAFSTLISVIKNNFDNGDLGNFINYHDQDSEMIDFLWEKLSEEIFLPIINKFRLERTLLPLESIPLAELDLTQAKINNN